jgi:hypothetical protein
MAAWSSGALEYGTLWRYARVDDQPELLLAIWPVLLALLLLVSGWPQLLAASALAMLALGLSDLVLAAAGRFVSVGLDSYWRAVRLTRDQTLALMVVRGVLAVGAAVALYRARRPWKRVARRERVQSSRPPAIAGRLGGSAARAVGRRRSRGGSA